VNDYQAALADPQIAFRGLVRSVSHPRSGPIDLVGAPYFAENIASIAVKGRMMLVGLTGGRTAEFNLGAALQKRMTLMGTVLRGRSLEEKAEATKAFIEDVVPLLASGQIRPNLDRTFSAVNVVEAYEYLASNESFGKVVLEF